MKTDRTCIRHVWVQLQRALEQAHCRLMLTLQAEAVASNTPAAKQQHDMVLLSGRTALGLLLRQTVLASYGCQ